VKYRSKAKASVKRTEEAPDGDNTDFADAFEVSMEDEIEEL
jgi:hypothetical protein